MRRCYAIRFYYEQPRLWYTKGQTLQAFLDLPGKREHDLTSTRSCWQNRRIVNSGGSKKHCGLCAACLLRRQSLHAAAVTEMPATYLVSDLSTSDVTKALSIIPQNADRNIMVEYGSVGARHLQHLADMAVLPDDELRVHVWEIAAATGATFQDTLKNLRNSTGDACGRMAGIFIRPRRTKLLEELDGGRTLWPI